MFSTSSLFCFQDMFQERSRMSSAHEANTQRLISALRDKETALKVRMLFTLCRFSIFLRSGFSFIRSPNDNYWFPSQRPLNSPHSTKFMFPLTEAVWQFLLEKTDSYGVRLKPITVANKELNIQCTESNNGCPWLAVIARLLFILSCVPHILQNVGSSDFLAI